MAVRRNNKRKNTRVTRRPNFRKNTRGGVKIRKKQLVRARQSIVETKKRSMGTLSGKLDVGRFITHFSTRSFLDLRQGLLESQMVGQNIFSKYYSMKIKLNFPTTHPIVENFRLQLVWGWMTAPLAYPASSNTGAVTRDEVDLDDIQTVVAQRVEHDFNQKIDQMNFRDKEKTVYRVLGKEWVKPDRRHQIGHNQSATAVYNPSSAKVEWYERGSLEPWTKQFTLSSPYPKRLLFALFTSNSL